MLTINCIDNSVTVLGTTWHITRDKVSRHYIGVCMPEALVAEGVSLQELLSTIHEIVTNYKSATQNLKL